MKKIVHEIHRMKNPRSPFIYNQSRSGENGILPNWHENIEILCFFEGEGALTLDGRSFHVGRGDVAVVNPERLHVTVGEPYLLYHCLIIDNRYCIENGIDVGEIEFAELIRDEALFAQICEVAPLFARMREGDDDPTLPPALRYCALGILLSLLSRHTATPTERSGDVQGHSRIKGAVRYLRDAEGAVTLDELARAMGMSKFYLCREFRRLTGTTVVTYLNRIRCEKARRLIYEGAKVSEAAFAVGFDNLSYFSRTFLRYTGIRPSDCQRREK